MALSQAPNLDAIGQTLNDSFARKTQLDDFWQAIHIALVGAANVSLLLWGSGGKKAESRRPLRESIGVDDNSYLKDLQLRNHFEHFDERLERWWDQSEGRNFGDKNIGPVNIVPSFGNQEWFRSYDPQTGKLSFWREEVNLLAVFEELSRIHATVAPLADLPHWVDE